jgi:hypothetical protein
MFPFQAEINAQLAEKMQKVATGRTKSGWKISIGRKGCHANMAALRLREGQSRSKHSRK